MAATGSMLDQPDAIHRRDPKGMYGLTVGFPDQCLKALRIAESAPLPREERGVHQVVLTGLGGSAAGGDFVRTLFDAEGAVPFAVNRDYHLPAWAGGDTLVIASSYSGNTEETLSAYADARRRGARLIAVTSGGTLGQLASADGIPCVTIPGGQPPRTAMGYMMVPAIVATTRLGLLAPQDIEGAVTHMKEAMRSWLAESPQARNEAKQLASILHQSLGVLYGLGGWQGVVASRWKGQVNENAKQHLFAHALPEMNHNEILGWEGAGRIGVARWVALLLEDGSESDRMRLRADVTLGVVGKAATVRRIRASGPTLLARMLTLALLGDLVSLYLAALNDVDPYTIAAIDLIKERLSQA